MSNQAITTLIIVLLVIIGGYWLFNSPYSPVVRRAVVPTNYLTATAYPAYTSTSTSTYPVSYSQPKTYITYPIASSTAVSYNTPRTYSSSTYYTDPYTDPGTYYPPTYGGGCYVSGCSAQICSDQPNMVSTCEYRPDYACYQYSRCERQASGQCGWTPTSQLLSCLSNTY